MKYKNVIMRFLSSKKLLYVFVLGFSLYFLILSFARHNNYYSLRFDLGNMDQTIWNVLHGNGFTLTNPTGLHQESRLAIHADFILILLAPIYILWSDPRMLLAVQALFLGLGAIPIYWIAEKKLRSRPLALMFAIAYLLYPPRERTTLYDFHPVALASPFLLFAYWYLEQQQWVWFGLFALFAGICKEQIWLTVTFLGVYIVAVKKKIGVGIWTIGISLLIFYLLLWKFIPSVTPEQQHFALVYLSEFGSDQNDIIKNILLQPEVVWATVMQMDRLRYLFQLFFPVGLLPLFFPWPLLFVAESFAINLLSNDPLMRLIDFQYNSVISPFIFIAAVEGFFVVRRWFFHRHKYLVLWVTAWFIVCTVVGSYLWGELPYGRDSYYTQFTTPQRDVLYIDSAIRRIGSDFSVSATNNVGAHLSQRKVLYNFPLGAQSADYVVAKIGDPYAWPNNAAQVAMIEMLKQDNHYELIAQKDNFYVFRRKK